MTKNVVRGPVRSQIGPDHGLEPVKKNLSLLLVRLAFMGPIRNQATREPRNGHYFQKFPSEERRTPLGSNGSVQVRGYSSEQKNAPLSAGLRSKEGDSRCWQRPKLRWNTISEYQSSGFCVDRPSDSLNLPFFQGESLRLWKISRPFTLAWYWSWRSRTL